MESVQERMKRLGTKEKIASFIQKEKQPYNFKRRYAQIRAEEFANECDGRGLNYHVSVGGWTVLSCICFYMRCVALTPRELARHHWKISPSRKYIKLWES